MMTPNDVAHAETIAAWLAILVSKSNGGCGVSLKSEKPASITYPHFSRQFYQAVDTLGWHYTHLPFEVARRMSSIPTIELWQAKREERGNPPLMGTQRAQALLKHIKEARQLYETVAGGCGAAACDKIITEHNRRTAITRLGS